MKFYLGFLTIAIFLIFSSVRADQRQFDVIVYAATPAGIAAAITVAKEGKNVLILEPQRQIGGMMVSGLSATDHCNKRVIGGFSRQFFKLVGQHYGKGISWRFEAHVAAKIFADLVKQFGVRVVNNFKLQAVEKLGLRIDGIRNDFGEKYTAKIFIDASYEGDLLAQAGISYATGRESAKTYDEELAGVRLSTAKQQFSVAISPYLTEQNLLPDVLAKLSEIGSVDQGTMAYNFRLCVTTQADNWVQIPAPKKYDPDQYIILARMLRKSPNILLKNLFEFLPISKQKFDLNNKGAFSLDYIGGNHDFPEADWDSRQKIVDKHKEYTKGLFYFLQNDRRVPQQLQVNSRKMGLCKDEFIDNGNWPYFLYVRVARRMLGEYVLTEKDLSSDSLKSDSVGMASCPIESHSVNRVAYQGVLQNEGWIARQVTPYQIPYASLTPKASEVTNLLVPVALSASHVAYSSLRMEPVFMILGESAGVAAAQAIDSKRDVQLIDLKSLQNNLRAKKQRLGKIKGS